MHKLSNYKSLVFDCDGVILNSNSVKTDAFYKAALPFGKAAAESLVSYHLDNGGVSRYKKVDYFFNNIVTDGRCSSARKYKKDMLFQFSEFVREGLLSCEISPCLEKFRELTAKSKWLVVSGGDQIELREIFNHRTIDKLFDGGIYGSPDTKDEILAREIGKNNIQLPAVFIGDSKLDFQAATAAKLDFIFLSEWTDIADWKKWVLEQNILHKPSISSLVVN